MILKAIFVKIEWRLHLTQDKTKYLLTLRTSFILTVTAHMKNRCQYEKSN